MVDVIDKLLKYFSHREEQKTQLLIAVERQKVVEKEAETERKRAVISECLNVCNDMNDKFFFLVVHLCWLSIYSHFSFFYDIMTPMAL